MNKNFLTLIFAAFVFVFMFSFSAEAQKKKPQKQLEMRSAIEEVPDLNAQVKDFAFVVEIDKNANVSLKIQKAENDEFIADDSFTADLTEFFRLFSDLQNGPAKQKNKLEPVVVVKADNTLEFGKITKIIESLRVSSKQKLKLQISENSYIGILPLVEKEKNIKPNPLFLIVEMQNDGKIKLNNEPQGSFQNFNPLKAILNEIFQDREEHGTFRVGSNEVEKTVFVKVPNSLKFSDVIRLVQAIEETGANPIGLQLGQDNSPIEIESNILE